MLTLSPSGPALLLSVICRNLSRRQEECSGPAPSNPWGSSITIPLCSSHFAGCGEGWKVEGKGWKVGWMVEGEGWKVGWMVEGGG